MKSKFLRQSLLRTESLGISTDQQQNTPVFRGDIKQYIKDKEESEMGDVSVGKESVRIISKICSYFKDYIEKNNPEVFIFHAKNDDRAKHYSSFGRMLAKKTGYSI